MRRMSTIVDAIYEEGIFRPVSDVRLPLKEHERVRITIISDEEASLAAEFAEWDAASAEDSDAIERKLEEIG
jgi:predicted DNA-binding antitoxin AbrB/MazE fold protein